MTGPAEGSRRRTTGHAGGPHRSPGIPDPSTGSADVSATALRLARVHLRMGALLLARAELESFAGRGALDEEGLLDLAEARWRTGDLPGAGEAAQALLERGREDALALVIAAESVAAEGRPGEARRLASRALGVVHGPLDPLFAGMPRSTVWPADGEPRVESAPVVAGALPAPWPGRHRPGQGATATADGEAPASAAAAEALAGGLAALGGGDVAVAAIRLGVALRLEPDYADAVLDAIGEHHADAALALVVGDAYRLLGREAEALAAFDRARGHG